MVQNRFACKCGSGVGKLGTPSCVKTPGLSLSDIFQNTYNASGQRNGIPASEITDGVVNATYLKAMLESTDESVAWTKTPGKHQTVAPGRTDRTVLEGDTGTIKVLRNGVKTYSYELWGIPDQWSANINKGNCNEISVYKIDEAGNLSGMYSEDGTVFYPLAIEPGSLSAEPFDATSDKCNYTLVQYSLDRLLVEEGNYITISADELGVDLRTARALIEICVENGADTTNVNTTSSVFVKATNPQFGTFVNPYALVGMDDANRWNVSLASDGSPVNVTGVEELSDGLYRLDFDVQAASTELNIDYVETRSSVSDLGFCADTYSFTTP